MYISFDSLFHQIHKRFMSAKPDLSPEKEARRSVMEMLERHVIFSSKI
jgi:hypothetical protein